MEANLKLTFDVKYMFCFVFSENFADLPIILSDSVKIIEHGP